jgi:hypothetical protein
MLTINTFLTISAAFLVILYYDAELRIRSIFFRNTLQRRLAHITWNAPRLFFALAREFLGFEFIFEYGADRTLRYASW